MTKKVNLYQIWDSRNKFKEDGKCVSTLKPKLFKIRGDKCEVCKNTFNLNQLQLDHIVPVHIGGHPYKDNNIRLICRICHGKKSGMERHLFKILRDMKYDFGNGGDKIITPFTPKQLRGFYCYLKKVYESNIELYNNYKGWEERSYVLVTYMPETEEMIK